MFEEGSLVTLFALVPAFMLVTFGLENVLTTVVGHGVGRRKGKEVHDFYHQFERVYSVAWLGASTLVVLYLNIMLRHHPEPA